MNVGAKSFLQIAPKSWRLLAIFALALCVRLVYNLYIAQHRIIDMGDSFYYLTDGRLLARLVRESQSISAFTGGLCAAAKFVPGSFNSFSSLGLSDRLLIDGPIYPSYLAAIFLITGKALQTTAINANQLSFALANSFTDALLAAAVTFLAETAFGVTAGVLAGLFWCFYFPAVINTQQCYSEPVAALLLCLFVGAMIYQSKYAASAGGNKASLPLSLLVGILAGLVMLSKPVFVILPPLLLALHLIFLAFAGRWRSPPFSFTGLIVGVVVVLAPWLFYTRTISGAPQLMVNRAPGYNLFIGNYLPTDGWKTWPVVPGVPDSAADARKFIQGEAEYKPWQFASLLLRKIPRLWVGVWNDFHTSCFGVSYALQTVFHDLYLLLGCLSLAVLYAGRLRHVRPFAFAAATTMAWAIAFHFVYVLFEPVPRYAFTVMPILMALAAGGIVPFGERLLAMPKKMRLRAAQRILFLLLFVLAIAGANSLKMPVFYTLAEAFHDPFSLRLFCAVSMFLLFGLIGLGFILQFIRIKIVGPLSYLVLAKTFILSGLIAMAGALGDPTYLEYSARLNPKVYSSIAVKLSLPDLGKSLPPRLYLLADAQGESGAPDLRLQVNEKMVSTYALPLYELTGASRDIPSLLNLQGRMMDIDQRTFRQWWVYPVDTSLFHFGRENVIALFPLPNKGVKIFGDYFPPLPDTAGGENAVFPSLSTFSWSKGFLTADSRDPRPYEPIYMRGRTQVSWLSYGNNQYGRGALRLRLAVPLPNQSTLSASSLSSSTSSTSSSSSSSSSTSSNSPSTIVILSQPQEKQIIGQYPLVFESPEITVPVPLRPSSILHVHAQMRRAHPEIPATMALSLDFAAGKPAFSSVWQPSCLRLKSDWEDFDFKTVLPSDLSDWKNLKAHLLFSPYPVDRLYLHRREALRDSLEVRGLTIEIMPPALPGAGPASALRLM
jgi:4-amino-4-deoxy-L-arabinose transferase-like glycosyltransferase